MKNAYTFSPEKHLAFLQDCGDYNPIHSDESYVKQHLDGKIIVHGMHIILAAMEYWSENHTGNILRIKCKFKSPISVGDTIEFQELPNTAGEFEIRAYRNDAIQATISISSEITSKESIEKPAKSTRETVHLLTDDKNRTPENQSPAFFNHKEFHLNLPPVSQLTIFPMLTGKIGWQKISAIMSCSYFVGMVCPGLYSLCSSIEIALDGNNQKLRNKVIYTVDNFDERFGLYRIFIDGEIKGVLNAFQRKIQKTDTVVQAGSPL
jgi:hypothetical protein